MLNVRAQCQFQAIAQAAQVHRKRTVVINTGIGMPNHFLFGIVVVHGKGAEINRGVATRQHTEVEGFSIGAAAEQLPVQLGSKVKLGRGLARRP